MNEDKFTVAEAAKLLGIEQRLLRRRLRQGIVPGTKADNIWLISRSELESYGECSQSRAGFVSARGLLRKFGGSLSSEEVTLDKRREAELEEAKFGRQSGRPKQIARPDLEEAARNLTLFYREGTLTSRIAELEASIKGCDTRGLGRYLADQHIADDVLRSAVALKAVAGQVNVVIHATGMLLSLPHLLDEDEVVEYVSLGAGTAGKHYDLETDRRIAEFKFITWRGGSESIRQNQLFKDLFYLAEYEGSKRRCLYVVGKEHPLRFFRGSRALSSVLSKNQTLRDAFYEKHGSRFSVVCDYYDAVGNLVELHDLSSLVPFFSSF